MEPVLLTCERDRPWFFESLFEEEVRCRAKDVSLTKAILGTAVEIGDLHRWSNSTSYSSGSQVKGPSSGTRRETASAARTTASESATKMSASSNRSDNCAIL